MSKRARRFSLLDLLVTLGFTLGATAAALGVLAAVSNTGKRDGVLAELESDAEVALEEFKRDVRAARTSPQSAVAATANLFSLEVATAPRAPRTMLAQVVGITRDGPAAQIALDFGPGVSPPASATPFTGFLLDDDKRVPVTLTIEGTTATGQVPPSAAVGDWLVQLRLVYWRLAAAHDVTQPCDQTLRCALFRLVDDTPPSDTPPDLQASASARASNAVGWARVVEGVSRFDVNTHDNAGPIEVAIEMRRAGRGGSASVFKTRRSFSLLRGHR